MKESDLKVREVFMPEKDIHNEKRNMYVEKDMEVPITQMHTKSICLEERNGNKYIKRANHGIYKFTAPVCVCVCVYTATCVVSGSFQNTGD